MDKRKFDAGFKALCISVGYKYESNQDRIESLRVYYQTLSNAGFNDQIFEKTINKLILSWKPTFGVKFPAVADFLDVSGMSVSRIAEKAHSAIKNLIISKGAYSDVSFGKQHKHDVAHHVIREMGGWYLICQNPMDWDKRKNQFVNKFESIFYEDVPKNKPLIGQSNNSSISFNEKLKLLTNIHESTGINKI